MPERHKGPWQGRVQFSSGGLAFRPGEILVPEARSDSAWLVVQELYGKQRPVEPERVGGGFVRFAQLPDPLVAVQALYHAGIPAQVNHVLFATCCCPPHPADPRAEAFSANPFYAHSLSANPFYAHSFTANPFYAHAGGQGGCCGCGTAFSANPFYAHADPNPATVPALQSSGRRQSSARPSDPPTEVTAGRGPLDVRIAVLDTGYAVAGFRPTGLQPDVAGSDADDVPDEDGDRYLDPAAGHGTFIAGVIEQLTPGCQIQVLALLSTYGEGDEVAIARRLEDLAALPDQQRPHLVNLSFGGYTPMGMHRLAAAVATLQAAGAVVVASAGNDATCLPLFPAALPGVVGVAALDHHNRPAPFSNYGPWVRACTLGADVVSTFFEGFDGPEPPDPGGVDIDDFAGWAIWSGTSFAAPRVVAALARPVSEGVPARQAVGRLIDDPAAARIPLMGTIVLPVS